MQALRLHAAAAQGCLTALQCGQCRVDIGTERRRIDLEQGLAGAHFRTLLKQPALHDAAHLGTDLCGAYGGNAAGQFVIALHDLRADSNHADARCRFGRGFGGGAGRHGQGEGRDQRDRSPEGSHCCAQCRAGG
ncbi:hypothetical protein SM139_1351 [Stenotrophomonas maltophilia]|nr:hypothetical protein SM139_1351 [Stenotrophomonas maltophilia]